MKDLTWAELSPTSPNYFLVPRTETGRELYESFWSTVKILLHGSTGILTGRDQLAIALTERALARRLDLLRSEASDHEIESRFRLRKVNHWSLSDARKLVQEEGVKKELVRRLAYRPFDTRYYYDHDALVFRRRQRVMQHMTDGNIGLTICRLTKGGAWSHCLVTDEPADDSYVSDKSKERAYLFPLYLAQSVADKEEVKTKKGNGDGSRTENISPEFRAFLDTRYAHHYAAEEILGYIYAVLHAPTYRARYAEFLRIDFPRVPFPEAADDFERMSGLGWALVHAHLLRELPRRGLAEFHGKGSHEVEFVRYAHEEQAVQVNMTQCFRPVPPDVWEFHIGAYQVLDKYLKSRKGQTLSLDEINRVGEVADSLAFTIDQMAAIDVAYRAAFKAGDNTNLH